MKNEVDQSRIFTPVDTKLGPSQAGSMHQYNDSEALTGREKAKAGVTKGAQSDEASTRNRSWTTWGVAQ